MARHELRLSAGIRDDDNAARGNRKGIVNASKFFAKNRRAGELHICSRAGNSKILVDFDEYQKERRTAGNSEKQRMISLLFWRASLGNPRISAENEATLAVNFREEQRKQRGRASP